MTRWTIVAILSVVTAGDGARAGAAPLDCVIEPRSRVGVTAPDPGIIQEILVTRGSRVEKGAVVVRLNDLLDRLQVELSRVRAESDVEVRAQSTRRQLREQEFNRAQTLQDRDVGAASVLEDARIELALTDLAIESAEFAREQAAIELLQAEAMLERRSIRSPINGIVESVDAAPGEFATAQAPILYIVEIDPLHVEVFVPAEYFGRIREGQIYTVRQRPPLAGAYSAEVIVVDKVFDAASSTFGVRLELPNPDGAIPAGTRCTVEFDDQDGVQGEDSGAIIRRE